MRRRLVAAVWFGAWAAGTAALLYGSGTRVWSVETALYIVLPGTAAALSAALVGHRVLDPEAVRHGLWAGGHGAAVALVAHVFFAPMFAVGFSLTDPLKGTVNIAGFSLAALVFGVQATGLVTIPASAVAGYLLYRLRGAMRFSAESPTDSPGGNS